MVAGRIDMSMSRTRATPVPVPKTTRMHDVRTLTSLPAGRVVPLAAMGLLREDAVRRCTLRMSFEMMETVEVLMNAVNVDVKAYLISNLALGHLDGMDALNRAYMGVAVEGLPVAPFCWNGTASDIQSGGLEILRYLGIHVAEGTQYNTAYVRAYNAMWNFRARNRSQDLTLVSSGQGNLLPAFWKHQHFRHIVPDFDQAVIDGEVPLNVTNAQMWVHGIGVAANSSSTPTAGTSTKYPDGSTSTPPYQKVGGNIMFDIQANSATSPPNIFAELEENGITVSLSNIELARKTQAFARIKETYQGIEDDYIIDLLMQGIRIPDQAYSQPILLGEASTIFGMSKRYATDSTNLTESVVSGATFLDLTFRCPPVGPGGVIMVTAEITPEQLFERQRDPYVMATDVSMFPDYLRDTLDPEKVDVVLNGNVDAAHTIPTGTFGYEPLNAKWIVQQPRVGGRFYRSDPADVTNDEDRQRIWAVETVDPSLSADFYIATNIHTKPFVVQNQDPFEAVTRGICVIEGNTVFGGALVESTGSYDEVLAEAPLDRIDKPASTESQPATSTTAAPGRRPGGSEAAAKQSA